MAEKKKYNSILVSGRKDETLTYSRYVKDEESGESVKESLDKKVNNTDELETQQIKDGAIINEKLAADSVGNTNLQDGSVSNEKLEDGSITNEKLAENSITKDKLKDNTIGVEKLDPELRQTINAATGLPENLVETIQNVDDTLKDHQSQLEDKQQQITANDEDISLLQARSTQMEETIKSIAATGGASQATAVTYNNANSQLTAINIQSAIDELHGSKIEKTSISQESGEAEDKVMSQKAVSTKLSDLGKKTEEISHEDIQDEDDCVEFVSESGETVGKIDNNGADFTSLKKNGVEVLTAHQDISGLATKEEVDKKQDKIEEITTDNKTDDSEEIEFKSNNDKQTYAKINNNGVYAKEFYYLNGNPINSSNIRNIFVNKDGSADFTDVVSALESINVNDANKFIHNIYISEGTYDMFADWFKDKDYNDASLTISKLQGVLVPKNTNLIGVGKKENIILKGELPSEVKTKVSINFSALNLRGYDNAIENMTITCFNGRYAIHDQVGTECQDEYEHKFKNLVIIHKGFDEGATPAWDSTNNDVNHRWGSCHPLGQGTNNKANIYCEYVLFDCQNSYGASFLTHDSNSESSGGSHIVFNCCKFKNKISTVIDISSLGANHNNTIQITDCVFKSENAPQIHGAISSLSTSKDFIYYLYGRKNNENLVVNIPEGHEENNWLI